MAIHADDTWGSVTCGQLLVQLDRSDAELAYTRAQADLAQAVRQTRQLISNSANRKRPSSTTRSRYHAEAELRRTQGDLKRRREAIDHDQAIAKEEVQHARDAVNSASAQLAAAKAALTAGHAEQRASRALVLNDTAEDQPAVARAAAAVRESYLALARTEICAPIAGQIARRSAQPGARIQAGTPLMALAALDSAWVDANFKEGQLQRA